MKIELRTILIGIFALVLLGLGLYYGLIGSHKNPGTLQQQGTESQQTKGSITEGAFAPDTTSAASGVGTFRTLMAMGKDLSCTISVTDQKTSATTKETIYISGNVMRADLIESGANGSSTMHVINNGTRGYAWGATPQGEMAVMFDIRASQSASTESWNLDQPVRYACSPWQKDASLLVPPTGIQFMNVGMGAGAAASTSASGKQAISCATCAQVSDPSAKTQCMQAFSCPQ